MSTTGEKIREQRRRAVMTQAELAASAGISRPTLNLIESGQQEPRPSTLRKIAAALGVPASALVSDQGDK